MIKKLTSQQMDSRESGNDRMIFLGTMSSITFPPRLCASALKKQSEVAHA
jgi:hypothetical protein